MTALTDEQLYKIYGGASGSAADALRAVAEAAVQAAREGQESAAPVPEVIATLDSVLALLDGGFIRCETCGDQQDTKDMDVVSYLKEARAMLAAAKATKC